MATIPKKKAQTEAGKPNQLSVVSPDLAANNEIADFVADLEKLNSRAAAEESIRDLLEGREKNKFMLGGFLAKLQMNPKWWDDSYTNFNDYIEMTFGCPYVKGTYYIRIYKKLVLLGVPWKAFNNIGWTKVLLLLDVITKDNVAEWVEKAKAMNALSLKAATKAALAQGGGEDVATTQEVTTITFKAHQDQKELIGQALDKAMAVIPTTVKTVALEGICQEYLGAGISFTDWKQALTYARKHSDDPAAFVQQIMNEVEELCPELVITCEIGIKEN